MHRGAYAVRIRSYDENTSVHMKFGLGVLVALAVLAGGYALFINPPAPDATESGAVMDDAMMRDSASASGERAMASGADEIPASNAMMDDGGGYTAYAPEKVRAGGDAKVLLYFHADWCPLCRPLDAELTEKSAMLGNVRVLKVNYDTETALKQKYGVTLQHTFVQVDSDGNLIAKWSDARTVAEVLAKVR